jgi:GT2 family glycosyltransferase
MENSLISIVIVTWNRKEDVLETIRSIRDQAYQNVEIVVADNASTDGTAEAVAKAYPEVNLVALAENLGASGGRNAGIEAARGDIVFLLDSDASLEHNALTRIVLQFENEPDIGIIACKVVNAYTKAYDRAAGAFLSDVSKAEQTTEFLSYSFSECGCAIRREALDQAGLFWEKLFFGREGEELALRAWDAGYKILFVPDAIVYHRISPQTRIAGCTRLYSDLRNSLYIYLVRYTWWMLVFFAPLKIGSSLVKAFRRGCLRQTLRTLLDVLSQVPALLKERRPISNETANQYVRLLRHHGFLSWNLISWLKHKV